MPQIPATEYIEKLEARVERLRAEVAMLEQQNADLSNAVNIRSRNEERLRNQRDSLGTKIERVKVSVSRFLDDFRIPGMPHQFSPPNKRGGEDAVLLLADIESALSSTT